MANWSEKKILIAEDEEINFLFLNEILENTGLDILWAHNGREVIQLLKDHLDIDLVLMDIKMPVLNGFETTKKIREFNTTLPIIAQTAYAYPEDKELALKAGCNGYISKPINRNDLMKLLNQYLF